MVDALHTPGPWTIESWSGDEAIITANVGGRKVHVTLTCVKADAQLIAAAPEMFDALRLIAERGGAWSDIARAAIAKATATHSTGEA